MEGNLLSLETAIIWKNTIKIICNGEYVYEIPLRSGISRVSTIIRVVYKILANKMSTIKEIKDIRTIKGLCAYMGKISRINRKTIGSIRNFNIFAIIKINIKNKLNTYKNIPI